MLLGVRAAANAEYDVAPHDGVGVAEDVRPRMTEPAGNLGGGRVPAAWMGRFLGEGAARGTGAAPDATPTPRRVEVEEVGTVTQRGGPRRWRLPRPRFYLRGVDELPFSEGVDASRKGDDVAL